MKKKRNLIYLLVGVVIVVGLVASRFVDWPVDDENSSGNIAKSSHFSRKTADGGVSNIQELLENDEDYKNGLLTAYLVMKTRAKQFNALVDMSVEVAGNIKDYESLLSDMKKAKPMVNNVCASMEAAGEDLNAALGGEAPEDLAQNTSNAALAYSTLQKQNSLATRFIETADKYLQSNAGNDRLKFVRDQWVEYQQMTAALNQDKKATDDLNKKGYLLSPEKSAAALSSFKEVDQLSALCGNSLSEMMGVKLALRAVDVAESVGVLGMLERNGLSSELRASLGNVDKEVLGNVNKEVLGNVDKEVLGNVDKEVLGNLQKTLGSNAGLAVLSAVGNLENLCMSTLGSLKAVNNVNLEVVSNSVNEVIQSMATGDEVSMR